MVFEIENKVALISGGASGIGLCVAKELLQNGVKGVTIADINTTLGRNCLEELSNTFGKDKVIFVETDVCKVESFEKAFKNTVKYFGHVDILISSAAIYNDAAWEKEININLKGTINGILLGLENYILNHKSGTEGVILNLSSTAGANPHYRMPIYCATKSAILSLTYSFGHETHYKRTGVKVLAICPGGTQTALFDNVEEHFLGKPYKEEYIQIPHPRQSPEVVAKNMVDIILKAPTGTAWISEKGGKPYKFTLPDTNTMEKVYLNDVHK